MNQSYRHKETGVFLLNYHLIFCPKRRRPVLKGAVKERLEDIIHAVAKDIDAEVLALEVMPDHVHLFVSAVPQMAPNRVVGRFKGASSRILRQEFPHLLKRASGPAPRSSARRATSLPGRYRSTSKRRASDETSLRL